ncbi:MAG: DUF4037 domain-containing protein [Lachnospiraceae bacterium]|nr:DUF4037 domain-containing protein [Lachnospiraceae bacterium]
MKGLELAEEFYLQYGKQMLEEERFAGILPYTCCGLIGSGSECLGFDDGISADHDLEPGFIIFIPGEDVVGRRDAFLLERAYAGLPKEFAGLKRAVLAPVGGLRHGVIRIPDFLKEKTGTGDGVLTDAMWFSIPEQSLLEVTNGRIFDDRYGEMTRIREELSYYPERIWKKKLAGHLLLMGQAGQYNYSRCMAHGETGAAQLSVFEFVQHTTAAVFILNRRYRPYYKWCFRAMRELKELSLLAELMEYLITTDNDQGITADKAEVMESVSADIISLLEAQGLTGAVCGDLEKHAYSVNDSIEDADIRNMHILAAV